MVLFGGFLGGGLFVGDPFGLGGALIASETSIPLIKSGDITLAVSWKQWANIICGAIASLEFNRFSFKGYHLKS